MTTILGQHISLIRPRNIAPFEIRRDDRPRARYDKYYKSKTNKEHTGKVISVCVMMKNGGIRSIPVPATHVDVIEALTINPDNIIATGWELENGNYIWR